MKSAKTTYKTITEEDRIPFTLDDAKYGRAEFVMEAVFNKRGKVSKVIIRTLQRDDTTCYELKCGGYAEDFQISSWLHKTDAPHIWRMWYCREHKAVAYDVYPPDNTNEIRFLLSSMSVDVKFVKRSD